jgi:hypothetical protein
MKPGEDHVDELLDLALEETFPASDPIAVSARQDRLPELPSSEPMSL